MPIDTPDSEQERKADKTAQGILVQLRDLESTLSTMKRRIIAPKITAKLGDISSTIYRIGCLPQNEDPLTTLLPAEIQYMIWSYLTSPADRLMLALTCKLHATMFEELKGGIQKSPQAKKSTKSTARSSTTPKSSSVTKKSPTKLERLHVLIRLETWMPKQYRICRECLRFKPKKQPRRKTTLVSSGLDIWHLSSAEPLKSTYDEKEINRVLKIYLEKEGARCPDCNERAHLESAAARSAHKDLKRELARCK